LLFAQSVALNWGVLGLHRRLQRLHRLYRLIRLLNALNDWFPNLMLISCGRRTAVLKRKGEL